jgi:molybdate transport system ATP-binding protein
MSQHRFDIRINQSLNPRFKLDVSIHTDARAIALSGASGCGKTSVLHIVAGIMASPRATVRVGKHTWQDDSRCQSAAQRRVGLVLQDAMLFPLLDVRQNLCFGAKRAKGRIQLDDVVALLEIQHLLDRGVRYLSGGERQRVALGRALLSEPSVLLLDEPFAPLDPPRRDRLVNMLNQIRSDWDLPMMLISHDPVDIQALVDQVFFMDDGKVVRNKWLQTELGES